MTKKIILGLVALVAVTAGVVGLSAFEAHVINVTAKIENALLVDTRAIDFGTVFPQEQLEKTLALELSQSFLDEDRVDDVEYIIRQKPKCAVTSDNGTVLVGPTWTGHVVVEGIGEDQTVEIDCEVDKPKDLHLTEGQTAGLLPSLCEYISKHPDGLPKPGNDGSLDSFHAPYTINPDGTIDWNDVEGRLAKSENDEVDNWVIDLAVPCFGDHCAQDWEDFVDGINPDAIADDYVQDIANEHKIFGCNLWIEVNGVSETPGEEEGTITVTKVVPPNDLNVDAADFELKAGTEVVVSGVGESFAPGVYALTETKIGDAVGLTFSTVFSGDADCTDGSVTLEDGENISCTITNTLIDTPQGAVVGAILSAYVQTTTCDANVDDSFVSPVAPNFLTIQGAINDATTVNGETICVAAGTYGEDVNITKEVTLAGAGAASTFVIGQTSGEAGAMVIVANNVTVKGFDIIDATGGIAALRINGPHSGITVNSNRLSSATGGANAFLTNGGVSSVLLSNNEFVGNGAGQLAYVNGTASVAVASSNVDFFENSFSGTIVAGGVVLGNEATGADITENKFASTLTSTYAILESWEDDANVNFNNFHGVGGIKVRDSDAGAGPLDAENNWWGAAVPAGHTSGDVDDVPKAASAFLEN